MAKGNKSQLTAKQKQELIGTIGLRFAKNMNRHAGMLWSEVESRLWCNEGKLWSLNEMEETGGEPDVVDLDKKSGEYIFIDCAAESPAGRRSLCYDPDALASRKEHKPKNSAMGLATEMGVEMLTEEEYLQLQQIGKFDSKTSSWLRTPKSIRELGGALCADHRYGRTFIGHNGAESYYASRGFRASLRV